GPRPGPPTRNLTMLLSRMSALPLLACCTWLAAVAPAAADIPPWLPRYDLDIQLDVDRHVAHVHQRVTWTNPHARPTDELVFNVHSAYTVPNSLMDKLFLGKTLEILRMVPSEALHFGGPSCRIDKITLDGFELRFHYRPDNTTALVVPLP